MELLILLLLSFQSMGLILCLYFISKIHDIVFDSAEVNRQNQEIIVILKNTLQQTVDQVILLQDRIERLQTGIKASQSPNVPIKKNNWDSMRTVFKAPTKGDSVNE